ncbi:hypothetical protein Lfu02_52450 [Longispora fulva]|uniref:Putative membrane protein n=1 Tax=Longispora fulva TaxID=619741 RepID=A0A8J7GM72_9ACTN|nr:TMEM175 family protein [Longispora fulva]MBG6140861.1 putative membrane protein [Longispora fulva]GIG60873.1 hypothetical protein Lfu02_52450 [Longispora fulva]
MSTLYHRIAAGSLDRLAALSDGVFAVAITLLVLDIKVPVSEAVHEQRPLWETGAVRSEHELWVALAHLAPRLLPYLMSFVTLGMFWVGQQTQLNHFARSDRRLTWIHLAFLSGVTLMPFSTALLAEFITFRLALFVYWLNLLLLGAVLFASLRYARRAGLAKPDAEPRAFAAQERRIVTYQALYAASLLLCVVNTYLSIAMIMLLQLNSAIAPRIWPLNRI